MFQYERIRQIKHWRKGEPCLIEDQLITRLKIMRSFVFELNLIDIGYAELRNQLLVLCTYMLIYSCTFIYVKITLFLRIVYNLVEH